MCTAISYRTKDHYFGRNLDMEYSYDERVIITPRRYPFRFCYAASLVGHYAMIGMGIVVDNFPLYYDATNEKGLSAAGLLFAGDAEYKPMKAGKDNIASFELIPWILGQCATVAEAKELLNRLNLLQADFSEQLPATPLHWLIADREESITVECVKEGLKIYDNSIGLLTNSPAFDVQMFNLNNYLHISPQNPVNCFSDKINLAPYSFGMGAMGLPGDWSSMSRFVRTAFTKLNAVCGDSELESIGQFFHILDSVFQQKGCTCLEKGKYEMTLYSSCCNVDKGMYYYVTYENRQISAVNLYGENLNAACLFIYELIKRQQIRMQN